MDNKDKINKLCKNLSDKFSSRIISLIFFGSQRYKRSKIGSDFDLYLLLDKFQENDTQTIFKIVKFIDINIDLTIQYLNQMSVDPNSFQDGSMGCFALDYLAFGKCLLGENIFIKYKSGVNEVEYKKSLLRKINEYAYRYRREFTTLGLEKEYLLKFTQKYLARLITDILIYRKIYPLSKLRFLNTDETLQLVRNMDWFANTNLDLLDNNDESEDVLTKRQIVFETIYNKFIQEIQKNLSKEMLK